MPLSYFYDCREARMPSGKMIAWIVGLSLATYMGLERYKASKGG